jgi:hypothetical protein
LWTADSRRSSAGIYGQIEAAEDGHAENEVALMIGASMGIAARIAVALPSEGASAVVNCASSKDQAEGGAHVWDQG